MNTPIGQTKEISLNLSKTSIRKHDVAKEFGIEAAVMSQSV